MPVDKSSLIEESLEDLPLTETYGLMQLDLDDILEDIKLVREAGFSSPFIDKGKRIVNENSLSGFTGFKVDEDSLLGALARDAVSAAYKQIFLRQLLTDTAHKYELHLTEEQISLILPKINILKKSDVWQQFDQEIKPKLDCILKICNLAILADKNDAEITGLVTAFLKKGKTHIPSWFLKNSGLEPALPAEDLSLDPGKGTSVAELRRQSQNEEREQLLNRIMQMPVFSEINKNEAGRTIRILSRFGLETLRDVFEKLSGDFKPDNIDNLLKSYAASYSLNQSKKAEETKADQHEQEKKTKQPLPFNLDYSQIEADLEKHAPYFKQRLEDFFVSRKSISDLKSTNIKSISHSKAFEYRTEGKYRVYFIISDHSIRFVRIGDKTSQNRDTADMRRMYPK